MARTLRDDPAGAWHHVMNRGARHQPIFRDDQDRRGFLGVLDDLHRDDGIETHAYCLMGNHYHLVLFCPDGNLSVGMHHLGSRYAQRFNRRHGFDGPLFRGRFRSKPIDNDGYLIQASRYVHRNPLDLDPVIDLAEYPWSSYASYLGYRRAPGWLHRAMVLDLVGGDTSRYRAYVEAAEPRPADDEQPLRSVAIGLVEAVAAEAASHAAAPLADGRGRHTIVRNLALVLAVETHRATIEEMARHFGLGASSVWSAVHRTRARAEADAGLAAVLEDCRAALPVADPNETSKPGA